MAETYRRTGPDSKCPACGWRIDSDAYRCPKCFIYFCYKCRKRVQKGDAQFQCVNQTCACHGKLLCAACTVMVPEFADVTRYKTKVTPAQTNYGCGLSIATVVVFVIVSALTRHLVPGFIVAGLIFGLGAHFLPRPLWGSPEVREPDTHEQVTERKQVREHRCCIQCRTPTEILR